MNLSPQTVVRILTDVTGFLPGASAIHDLLKAHPQEAALLIPVVENLGEGASAIEAAEKAAPDLTAAIKAALAGLQPTSVLPSPAHAENFVRSLGGLGPMSPDQEQAWMDRFTPTGDG